MLHERPVEPDGWKDKLDRLDNLPGEPWADKNAAWDKLYHRLHEKPKRKASAWWLAAAVFLLLVLMASLLVIHKEDKTLVKNNSLPVHTVSPAPAPVQVEKAYPAVPAVIAGGRRPSTQRANAKNKKPLPLNGRPADTLMAAPVTTMAPTVNADTQLLANAMVLPSPKKLRVVHINELEAPAGNDVQTARQPNNRSFHFLLTQTEDAKTVSYETTNAGFNPFKVKIRAQN